MMTAEDAMLVIQAIPQKIYEQIGDTENKALNIAFNALKEKVDGRWIPVSERLPTNKEFLKDDGRFIVTDGNRVYQSLYDIYDTKRFIDVMYLGNANFINSVDKRVIAWQSLPVPYKESEEEE